MSATEQDAIKLNVLTAVQQLGVGGSKLSLSGEFRGGQCRLYKIDSTDDVNNKPKQSFAVRVPICMPDHQESINALLSEWEVLKTLNTKGFTWAPKPIQCSLTFDNPVKSPFLVLSWFEGSKACWNEKVPAWHLRDKFLRQLATTQSSLIECTLEFQAVTWRKFFQRIIENKRFRVLQGSLPEISQKDCDDQQALLTPVLGNLDRSEFAIDHGDLQPCNIIVDEKYNIIGIIDWGFASMVPLSKAASLPRFLWEESPFSTAYSDRETYIQAMASLSSQATLRQYQVKGDILFHALYLESLFSKGMHVFLANKDWKAT